MDNPVSPLPDIQALATLVHLARRARESSDATELDFIVVNESHALAPYRQSALWLRDIGVTALSGVVAPEGNAPYVQWLRDVFRHLDKEPVDAPRVLDRAALPATLAADWDAWLPPQGLWLTLPAAGRFPGGALLLARDQPWSKGEAYLLEEWAATWSQARALKAADSGWLRFWQRFAGQTSGSRALRLPGWRSLALTALIAAGFIPVHLTVLAPAELVPLNPAVIRAPLDGVVDQILVIPNQKVQVGDDLFEFDRANIQNRQQIALRALGTTQAEYRQKSQQALFDPISKSQLAVLQGHLAEKNTEVAYLRKLDRRGVVIAPRAGVALFDDPTEWIGRPVVTGERVMMVADEHAVEVEAWLSPADAIPLDPGAAVTLYLNADPLHPVRALLRYVGHEAMERPDGKYAYRVRATLEDAELSPRVGLKGTAKLNGGQVSLAYWALRRPLAGLRTWLGV